MMIMFSSRLSKKISRFVLSEITMTTNLVSYTSLAKPPTRILTFRVSVKVGRLKDLFAVSHHYDIETTTCVIDSLGDDTASDKTRGQHQLQVRKIRRSTHYRPSTHILGSSWSFLPV